VPLPFLYTSKTMTPNWIHNSGKKKNPRGVSKGKIKARKQVLQSIKAKYKVK
jgi:hypothetical protein